VRHKALHEVHIRENAPGCELVSNTAKASGEWSGHRQVNAELRRAGISEE
jgi:hypothetical protein